ncbi:hypothetical protein GCM10009712_24410 [Pseudarthrobacter sulfonivorans]
MGCPWIDTPARLLAAAGFQLQAFNEQLWLLERGYFAVALDKDKKPVDALASNTGHCLWTGIIDNDKAAQVAEHLVSPDMFTGWEIRTLASGMGAYNPASYHNGSVWPHDNAITAAGLDRSRYPEPVPYRPHVPRRKMGTDKGPDVDDKRFAQKSPCPANARESSLEKPQV